MCHKISRLHSFTSARANAITGLLLIVSVAQAHGATPASRSLPPPQAVAAGYITAVFDDEFNDPNDVSSTNTGIHNWYTYNGFDPNNRFGQNLTRFDYSVSNGVLTMTSTNGYPSLSTTNTNNPAISTPSHHATNIGTGLVFQYGYFEASIKFDPSLGNNGPAGGWPSFWSSAIQAYNHIYPYNELDFMEAWPMPGSNPAVAPSGTLHQWLKGTNSGFQAVDAFKLPEGLNLNDFNTYGCLWTPTKVSFYVNNLNVGSISTITATNTTSSGGGTGNTFTAANRGANYLQLGTGKNWPMQVDWVHVFQ